MGRIRTIKPEFPQSETVGKFSRDARLLFILLWTIADDEGRLRGSSRMLASLLYPYDDDANALIGRWLAELEREKCIQRYAVDDAQYIVVLNWLKHQKIDKPTKSRLPPPPESSRELTTIREASRGLYDGPGPGPVSRTEDHGGGGGGRQETDPVAVVPTPPKQTPDWMAERPFRVAKEIAVLCGKGDEFDFDRGHGTGWGGATNRVKAWIAHFEASNHTSVADEILSSVRQQLKAKRDRPPSTINFFEKGLVRHFAKLRAQQSDPLPVVALSPKQPETVQVSHARPDKSKSGYAAIDTVFEKLKGLSGRPTDENENAVLVLPARPVP